MPNFCRIGPRDSCAGDFNKHQKFDRGLRVATTSAHLCLRVDCCTSTVGMPLLAVPWDAVGICGEQAQPCLKLGQLVIDDMVLITFDHGVYLGVLAAKDARAVPQPAPQPVHSLEEPQVHPLEVSALPAL